MAYLRDKWQKIGHSFRNCGAQSNPVVSAGGRRSAGGSWQEHQLRLTTTVQSRPLAASTAHSARDLLPTNHRSPRCCHATATSRSSGAPLIVPPPGRMGRDDSRRRRVAEAFSVGHRRRLSPPSRRRLRYSLPARGSHIPPNRPSIGRPGHATVQSGDAARK